MRRACLVLMVLMTPCAQQLRAGLLVDFEGYFDQTLITTQYAGLVFSNTRVVTAGLTLNDAEFPQHGGNSAAEDCATFDPSGSCVAGGPVSIDFLTPVTGFSGYFTYAQMLTLSGLDTSGNPLPVVTSLFSENFISSGNPANELLSMSFAGGLSRVTITGNPIGGSFVMDDLTITTGATTGPPGVPEPPFQALAAAAVLIFLGVSSRLRASRTQSAPLT